MFPSPVPQPFGPTSNLVILHLQHFFLWKYCSGEGGRRPWHDTGYQRLCLCISLLGLFESLRMVMDCWLHMECWGSFWWNEVLLELVVWSQGYSAVVLCHRLWQVLWTSEGQELRTCGVCRWQYLPNSARFDWHNVLTARTGWWILLEHTFFRIKSTMFSLRWNFMFESAVACCLYW